MNGNRVPTHTSERRGDGGEAKSDPQKDHATGGAMVYVPNNTDKWPPNQVSWVVTRFHITHIGRFGVYFGLHSAQEWQSKAESAVKLWAELWWASLLFQRQRCGSSGDRRQRPAHRDHRRRALVTAWNRCCGSSNRRTVYRKSLKQQVYRVAENPVCEQY
jgi:hypothetical protein